MTVTKHFVEFYSPGTFIPESTTLPIDSWIVDKAVEMSHHIVERHSACPFGFRFSTRTREENDFDSKVTNTSPMHYLGGKIVTTEEVLAGTDPAEEILRKNVEYNDIKRLIINTNSWKFTAKLEDDDIVLDYTPREKVA
jgi:hypothetical protein